MRGARSGSPSRRLSRAESAEGVDFAKDLRGRDRVEVGADLRDKIGNQLRDAKIDTRDPDFAFKTQLLMNEYQQSYDLASRVSKAENEIYMVAIRHLVA